MVSEIVGVAAAEKRRACEEWLQIRGRYRAQRAVVKHAHKVRKEWQTGDEGNKEIF